jgi:putative nucleotidyltransferase with HDIG domain
METSRPILEPRAAGSAFERLGPASFGAYLLGAVVPLVALAAVVQRTVLPSLDDPLAAAGLVGLVLSIAALSLGSFLLMRRATRRSLARMEADYRRLAALLEASTALAGAGHANEAASAAAASALDLTAAAAAFVLVRDGVAGAPVPLASAGAQAGEVQARGGAALSELAVLASEGGRPSLLGPGGEGEKQLAAAVAVPLAGGAEPMGALVAAHVRRGAGFEAAEVDALSTLAALVSVALHNADLRHAQQNFFSHMTEILVSALDAHLSYHRGHGKRVAHVANAVGRELGLDEGRLQRLHFGALLHDIGMLKLDRTQKMNARTCERHCALGARMLAPIRLWKDLAPIVQHHHERWDGTGYPDRLAGEAIPLESRIIALCDAFDAMSSSSSYKIAMPLEEVMREIEVNAGSQFDPALVRVFHALVARGAIAVEE